MAKASKKKDELAAAGPAIPAATTPAPPAVQAPGSMRAAMKAAAVSAAPVKEAAGAPEDVKIDDKDKVLLVKINDLIEETAKRNAAISRMETLDADIRPKLIKYWFEKCRAVK